MNINLSPNVLKVIGIVSGILGYIQASVIPVLPQTPATHTVAQILMIAGIICAAFGFHAADAAPVAPVAKS